MIKMARRCQLKVSGGVSTFAWAEYFWGGEYFWLGALPGEVLAVFRRFSARAPYRITSVGGLRQAGGGGGAPGARGAGADKNRADRRRGQGGRRSAFGRAEGEASGGQASGGCAEVDGEVLGWLREATEAEVAAAVECEVRAYGSARDAACLPSGMVGELRRKLDPIALAVLLLFMGVGIMNIRVSAEFPCLRQRAAFPTRS
eukprot:COSAG04_NODE_13_length_42806_cov_92.030323_6_plen_202_part_00